MTACGGSGDSNAADEGAYRSRMSAICTSLDARLVELDDAADARVALRGALAARRSTLAALRAEAPPPALAEDHQLLVGAMRRGTRLAARLVRSLAPETGGAKSLTPLSEADTATFTKLAKANRAARVRWSALGLTTCG